MVNNFVIKSNIKNYQLKFVYDFKKIIQKQYIEGDVLIVDKLVFDKHFTNFKIFHKKSIIKVIANEKSKEFSNIKKIIKALLKFGIKKNNKIIACGGGITQDISSFIASILFRGVDWIFFPTTLLAQGDSCIGSKTSINFIKYKNQLGTFYPPSKIFLDKIFLDSLNKQDINSGLGEISHYLIIGGKKSFSLLENHFIKKKTSYKSLIIESLKIKKKIIEIDEFDKKERIIFNYGHTFGHAIESITNYKIPHGIAVSMGIDIANFFSVHYGYMNKETKNKIKKTLNKLWKLNDFKKIKYNRMIEAIKNDKKFRNRSINLILCTNYGSVFKKNFKIDSNFRNLIKCYFNEKKYN